MKKWLICLAAVAMLLGSAMAAAEIHVGQRPPVAWGDENVLRLRVIDVDRNDAMLLSCGGEHMLVDAGTTYFVDRVISALDSEGVTALKYLFSTHSDDDHIGGFSPLLHAQRYEMGEFLSPNAMNYKDKAGFHQMVMTAVRKHEIPYRVLEDGEVLMLGDAQLTVLRCMESWGRNARSACLSIRFGNSSMLLTGDLTNQAMTHYLGKYDHELLRADVLKVPHHGVVTIPPAFMDAVAPQFMFLNNTREKADAFARDMERRGVTIPMLYAGDGAVVLETNGDDWYIWQEENW